MAEKKYVIFKLNDEEYGVDIMKVKEVSEVKEITKVPNTPDFVDGIINIRGDVTPIINLKKRFHLAEGIEFGEISRIIVANIEGRMIGFLVDDASQVISIEDTNIEPAPEIIAGSDKEYIEGIGKVDSRMIIILNFEDVLDEDEKNSINSIEF
ncbi:MAG: chemotaxis protein CheW [Tepidibacter sp.]|jgi:purine-binding chemotaxis protein CheW|uniref:chemotaxis protein CheW n=1 Tax=Tepidibacter sp. TaxID=2529387 RepID=UPI0025CD4D88|nr:chemotaxis protein CheW [Tepidibacter sp.]MCT4508369.1 chemotaxis protein CheW [Tepidibacter sp.]